MEGIARLVVLGGALALIVTMAMASAVPDGRRWHSLDGVVATDGRSAGPGQPAPVGRRWT